MELATVKQIETFTRSDRRTWFWGQLDLGTNLAQLNVPVTYRYQVSLRSQWKLEVAGDHILVEAPAIQAALPPAIHSDQLARLSVRGWARGSTSSLVLELERQLTPRLSESANDPRRLQLVRETCRQSVAAFIQLWLEREGQWGGAGFRQIAVQFADEAARPPSLLKQPRVRP